MGVPYRSPSAVTIESLIRMGVTDPNQVMDASWTPEQKKDFTDKFKARTGAAKEAIVSQDAARKRAFERNLEISGRAAIVSEDLPGFRDIAAGVESGVKDLLSLAVRPFSSKTADEMIREGQKREEVYARAGEDDIIPDILQTGMRGAARSVATAAILAPLGPKGIIAGFAATRGNQAITEAEDAGLTGADKWKFVGRAAAIEGGIAAGFQAVGMGGFETLITRGITKSGLKAFFKQTGVALLHELPEENITEILDEYNQIVSGVSQDELTLSRAWEIMKQTSIQTVMAVGATGSVQAMKQQDSLKRQEQFAEQLAEQYGLSGDNALSAVQRASTKKGDFSENLGRELLGEVRVAPVGLAEWAKENPEKAATLADKEKPTRKDFEAAGLPRRSGAERARIAADVIAILESEADRRVLITPSPSERRALITPPPTGKDDTGGPEEAAEAPVTPPTTEPSVTAPETIAVKPAPVAEAEPPVEPPRVGKEGRPVAEIELYGRLGVDSDATTDEIHAAARKRMAQTHPDVGGDTKIFQALQEADRILTDPELRAAYDEGGMAQARKVQKAALKESAADTLARAAEGFDISTEGRTRQDIAHDVAKARRSGRKAKPVTKKAPTPVTPAKKKSKGLKKASVAEGDIYPLGDKFAIRGEDSKGLGDLVFDSRKEAQEHIVQEAELKRANAEFRAKQDKATAAKRVAEAREQALTDDIDGFADDQSILQKNAIKQRLNKTLTLNDGEVRTRKDHIRKMVAEDDPYLGIFDEDKIQPMTAMQSHRATQAEQDAHQKRIDDAGTKKVYRVNGFDLGKTGYDYAAFLIAQKAKDAPAPKPKGGAATGKAQAALDDTDSFATPRDETKDGPEPPPEVVARAAKVKSTAAEVADAVLSMLAPAKRGPFAKLADLIRRRRTAEAAQLDEIARAKLHKASKVFRFMPEAEIVDFIDRMEDPKGMRPQATAELDEIAAILREMLDKGRARVQEFGVLEEYIENYFPHLFKDPNKSRDVISGLLSKRRLAPTGFLQQRKYLTLKEGLDAGLELAHFNPVEMTILRLHEMHKYIAGKNIKQDLKQSGMAVFVPSSLTENYKRQGWEFVDDPDLIVQVTPEITIKEAYDKLLVDQLMGVAAAMGVTHERLAKMRGRRLGESGPGKHIKTKFATPASVIAHEIGHQIGDQYDLYNHMLTGEHTVGRRFKSGAKKGQPVKSDQTANRAAIREEFRALADLRHEGSEVTKTRQQYERRAEEKEAVILEAWLAAPEKMAKVAPKITEAWKAFLADNDRLTPLLNLDRSVVFGTSAQKFELEGVLTLGRWALPKEAAAIINAHLSPGLSSHKNFIVRNVYDGLRRLRNVTLMASHGLSAFHAINVSSDAINSHIGLGAQKLSRGDWRGAIKMWRSAYKAPVSDVRLGGQVIAAMQQELETIDDPIMRSVVEAAISAGAKASLDAAYRNDSINNLVQSIRDIKFGGLAEQTKAAAHIPLQAAMALIEATSVPIMRFQVPRLKMGVFYHMASDIYEQAEKRGWDAVRIQSEMAKAWDNVENRMGQLNYDNLNWNRTVKEIVMLAFRAPGWTLGSIREFGGGAIDAATFWRRIGKDQDIITSKMGYAFGAAISYAIQGMVLQYLLTGEPPEEVKDLYFPRTGRKNADGSDERLSMPHYTKDIIAWTTDPIKTIQHKLNPLWGTALDLWDNEDYFGRQIREGTTAERWGQGVGYFVNNMFMPFSIRNAFRLNENGESVALSTIIGATGISPAPGYIVRSPAQKMMIDYLRGRGGARHVSQEDADKSILRRNLIRDIRAGLVVPAADARWDGFTDTQRRGIIRDAGQSSFATSYKRLAFHEAVNVFTVASKEERIQAWEALLKKRIGKDDPDPDTIAVYYELKLTQAQVDEQVAGDIQVIRNASWGLARKGLSSLKQDELLKTMRSSKQWEDGMHFSAFRHRWLWTLKGKKSGRRIGTTAYWQHVARLRKAVSK